MSPQETNPKTPLKNEEQKLFDIEGLPSYVLDTTY